MHLLDLDLFKNVNDTLGHPAGDKLLKMVTARLRARVSETDTVARMGGDEFAIVQTRITQPVDATTLGAAHHRRAERALRDRRAAGDHRHQRRHRHRAGGRAQRRPAAAQRRSGSLSRQGRRARHLSLLRAGNGRADAGAARHGARSAQGARRRVRAALPTGRRSRRQRDQRLRSPDPLAPSRQGHDSPGAFIPVAEESGFIIPLGEWAIRQACAAAAEWPEHTKIAVNLSPAQFRSAGLVQRW